MTRRSLTHVGGAVETHGDPRAAAALARALDVPRAAQGENEEGPDRAHVHGFHTYPARMHPVTAARLVDAFSPAGGVVLDPFAGSGTVLVEAMLAGRRAVGADLNPLAVRLARLKTRVRARAERDALSARAREVAAFADARRKARAGATRRYGADDVALFVKKADDLAARLAAFAASLPSPAPRDAKIEIDDATRLVTVADASVDCAVTSPPYVATYDYLAHHAARMRWLGLDARAFEAGELGARRNYASATPREAGEAWAGEVLAFLRALARVLRPSAPAALLVADSAVRGAALRADAVFADAAPRAGLRLVARASQERPHFHGPTMRAFEGGARREHAILLSREG